MRAFNFVHCLVPVVNDFCLGYAVRMLVTLSVWDNEQLCSDGYLLVVTRMRNMCFCTCSCSTRVWDLWPLCKCLAVLCFARHESARKSLLCWDLPYLSSLTMRLLPDFFLRYRQYRSTGGTFRIENWWISIRLALHQAQWCGSAAGIPNLRGTWQRSQQ